MRRFLLVCLLASVPFGAYAVDRNPAGARDVQAAIQVASGNRLRIVRPLGSGNNQHAYLVEPRGGGAQKVLKIFRPKDASTSDPAVRNELANVVENTAGKLRSDPDFLARFGDIVPEAHVVGEGATLQTFLDRGTPFASLPEAVRATARGEMAAAVAMARDKLHVPISANDENFLFDEHSGRIVGWFDHLSHSDLPKHLEEARAAKMNAVPALGSEAALHAPRLPGFGVRAQRIDAWHAQVDAMLRDAVVVDDKGNAARGANASRVIVLRAKNGRLFRAVWKPVDGESATIEEYPASSGFGGTRPYPLGSLYRNEVGAAQVAAAIGLGWLVPPTIERTIGGKVGSLQLFVEGAQTAQADPAGRTLDRAAAEKLRVFDYLIGNADRTAPNLLVRTQDGKLIPAGIDQALSLPRGTVLGLEARPMPTEWIKGQTGPLLPETVAFVRSIDASTVARVLNRTSTDKRQIAHVLRRLEHMKRDPSFLEIKGEGAQAMREMLHRVAGEAGARNQGLPQEEVDHINVLIDAAR